MSNAAVAGFRIVSEMQPSGVAGGTTIALMEVHRELHRIGALLRGLASNRSMVRIPGSDDEVGARLLAAVAEIEHQLRGLRRGIEGNFEYWSADL